MARIPSQSLKSLPPSLTFVIMAVAVVSLLSAVAFLCGSTSEKAKKLNPRREKKTVRLGDNKTPAAKRLQTHLSSKALSFAKMISWRKVENDGEEEENVFNGDHEDDDEALWRKTIIKGEKCRPLDFSGTILYDSDGNLIPDSSSPPLPQSQ